MDMRYQALPRNVREHVDRIGAGDVAAEPSVADAQARVLHVERQHAAYAVTIAAARDAIDAAVAELSAIETAIVQIDSERPSLALRVVRGEADDAADQDAQARRADLVRRRELWQLGVDRAREDFARAGGRNPFGEACARAQEALEEARWAARVARAEALAR